MTLNELIDRLGQIRLQKDAHMGNVTVIVKCPVANVHCWLHGDNINYTRKENPADPGVVIIEGGFGA